MRALLIGLSAAAGGLLLPPQAFGDDFPVGFQPRQRATCQVATSSTIEAPVVLSGFPSPVSLCAPDDGCAGDTCEGCAGGCAGGAGCDLCTSAWLTGDWGGRRTAWAECGVTLDADVTNFWFGNYDGGLRESARYAGHGDYVLNVDFGKMGGPQGLSLKVRAEHRFGTTINGFTGSLMPATILPALPPSENEEVLLTNVLFTQALSESFAVFFGKLDTLDGDLNAFASGRGKEQFSNLALLAPPTTLLTVPYSTLGAGFIVLHEAQPVFLFSVLNSRDTSRTSGFDELFEDGVALSALVRVPVQLAGRPGVQAFGATWNSRDYNSLGQDPRILTGDVAIAERTGSWSFFWSGHHYLYVDPCDPTKGWGVFGRAGISDGNPNPLEYFLSFGIGGTSPLPGRENDTFGIGWYRNDLSDELGAIATQLGGLEDGQGIELYYSIAVTPWLHVTPDVQFLVPEFGRADDATVAGVRVNVDF